MSRDDERHARDPRPGSRIGVADPVSAAWSGYSRSEVESRSTVREVHEDVLRESGFTKDRAREIAAASADEQARLLDTHRDDGVRPPHAIKPRPEPSGFDIRKVLAGLDRE